MAISWVLVYSVERFYCTMHKLKSIIKRFCRLLKKLVKKAIKFVDSHILGGIIAQKYALYKATHGEQIYDRTSERNRHRQNGKKIKFLTEGEFSVKDIILAQYFGGDYEDYRHCDCAVRLLAIEEYYGMNDFGFNLYQRMQAPSGFDWRDRFKNLIRSYESSGYECGHPVELDRDLNILDGSHRLTLAYRAGQEFVDAKLLDTASRRKFGIEYFWENDFSDEECKLIEKKTERILEDCNYSFIGVIWPPAVHLSQEIIDTINIINPENIQAVALEHLDMEMKEFEHVFKALYHTDILDEAGMEEKISLIKKCLPAGTERVSICPFKLKLKNPRIGINPKNLTAQSQAVKQLKTTIRKRFEGRIPNYQYDVIVHIADNYLQSQFCSKILKMNTDLTAFFDAVRGKDYVVLRAKESRQHSEFPKKIYVDSDSNYLIKAQDADFFMEKACDFLKQNYADNWMHIKQERYEHEWKVKLFMRDFCIYQFEFQDMIFGLDHEFVQECWKHIQPYNGYNTLPDSDEIVLRVIEYARKPHKKWYEQYLKKHWSILDGQRLLRHLDKEYISPKKVDKLLKKMDTSVRTADVQR